MREKLNTLPLSELKELAKAQGLKGISSLRKAELVDLLCRSADKTASKEAEQEEKKTGETYVQQMEAVKTERAEKNGQTEKTGQEDKLIKAEKNGQTEKESQAGKNSKTEKESQTEKNSQAEKTGQAERPNSGEKTNPPEKNSQVEKNSQAEKPAETREETPQGDVRRRDNRGADRIDGGRANKNRNDGKGNRMAARFENRGNYTNRNNYQDNGRNSNGNRSQENGRNQDGGRNQESGRYSDGSRSQENGRNQDGSRNQENGRNQDNSRNQDNGSGTEGTYREMPRADVRPPEINQDDILELDSGLEANGILEVMPDGFGFIRCENFLPGENDVYVAPSQIRRFNMKTGDIIRGNRRIKSATEKFAALLYVTSINGYPVNVAEKRPNFEDLTPIFPNERIHMETLGKSTMAMRVLDLMAPIGKGQRGMIVSPPKAGKTTLLKQVAKAITANQPDMHLIILLIDERPEEVTDIKEAIVGSNVEVIYSTFDELPERHKRVSEMVIERARRLVEHGRDVTILLDSITRLARAYNLVVPPSGRTLSGGLDPAALHMPKRFFGAARNMREGGSLTILATALIDTGSRMDDVIYEEFKGTGNMELVLDRKLSERRIFPAIDILKSGTRRDDLLLSREESEAMEIIRRATNAMKPEESVEKLMDLFAKTRSNQELVAEIRRRRYI